MIEDLFSKRKRLNHQIWRAKLRVELGVDVSELLDNSQRPRQARVKLPVDPTLKAAGADHTLPDHHATRPMWNGPILLAQSKIDEPEDRKR
jgi:hypothetical protein